MGCPSGSVTGKIHRRSKATIFRAPGSRVWLTKTASPFPCRIPIPAAPCPIALWKTIRTKMRPLRGLRPASLHTAAEIVTPCPRSGCRKIPMRALSSAPASCPLPRPLKSGPPAFAVNRGPTRPLPPDHWVSIWMPSLFSLTVTKLPTINDRFWRDLITF